MKNNQYYIAEIASMSYMWFLTEHLLRTVKFKNKFFKNEFIDNTLNFILFPFLILGSPIIAFFQKQYCEDISNKKHSIIIDNFVTYSSQNVVLFRNNNNEFDSDLLNKNTKH
tara:strand:- start:2662 stop:2997 length:336 start_codon:yes stop_codon:yes gene_type:complete